MVFAPVSDALPHLGNRATCHLPLRCNPYYSTGVKRSEGLLSLFGSLLVDKEEE